MKKIVLFGLTILLSCGALSYAQTMKIQPPTPKPTPKPKVKVKPDAVDGRGASSVVKPRVTNGRTVLYSLGPNEEINNNEFFSNAKVSGNKFMLITYNPVTKKSTLVVNGTKLETADDIFVFYADLDKPGDIAYRVENNDKYYYNYKGEKNGPYDELSYAFYPMYNLYKFKRMGNWFRHDSDGSIYRMESEDQETDPVYKSMNGRHSVSFQNNLSSFTLDGVKYNNFAPLRFQNSEIFDVVLDNDGSGFLRIFYEVDGEGEVVNAIIRNGKCIFAEEEDFWEYCNRYANSDPAPFGKDAEDCEDYKANDEWKIGLDIALQDKSKKHLFVSNWRYNYVMIDDKIINCEPPIRAFYDEANNSFGWICLEGRDLVLYSYSL